MTDYATRNMMPSVNNKIVVSNHQKQFVRYLYILSFLCALFSFCPLLQPLEVITDYDRDINIFDRDISFDIVYFRGSCISAIVITIPSIFDLLLDVFGALLSFRNTFQIEPSMNIQIVRMNNFERLLYIIGTASFGFVTMAPYESKYNETIYLCSCNFNTIMVVVPVLIFLNRHVSIFTSRLTSIVCAFELLTSVTGTITLFFQKNSDNWKYFTYLGIVFALLASLSFLSIVGFGIYDLYKQRKSNRVISQIQSVNHNSLDLIGDNNKPVSNDFDYYFEMYNKHFIEITHIGTTILFLITNIVWYAYPSNFIRSWGDYTFVYTIVSALTLVTEFRARKNLIQRGLVSSTVNRLYLLLAFFTIISINLISLSIPYLNFI